MQYRGNRHQVTIAGQTFWVDSNQEETLILWLEANGFADRWRHTDDGINHGRNNYTPDLELSVQLDSMTHRALVESKPYKAAFTPYISRRMRGVAKYYFTDVLLLYVHDEDKWYRVDQKTGDLTEFGIPVPGEIPINKLYRPFTVKARRIRSHTYRERADVALGRKLLQKTADGLEFLIQTFLAPRNPRRRSRKRKR